MPFHQICLLLLFRATVSLNRSIKVFGYQIRTLIDFPKPSASGLENLKVMLLSTWKTNKGLDKDSRSRVCKEKAKEFSLQAEICCTVVF